MFTDLLKATVAIVTTPIDIAADVITLGGSLTDKDEPYTVTKLKTAATNIENAVKPNNDG